MTAQEARKRAMARAEMLKAEAGEISGWVAHIDRRIEFAFMHGETEVRAPFRAADGSAIRMALSDQQVVAVRNHYESLGYSWSGDPTILSF